MSRNRYRDFNESQGNVNGYGDGSFRPPPINENEDDEPYGAEDEELYGPPSTSAPPPLPDRSRSKTLDSKAEKIIGGVLEHLRTNWPAMCQNECVPVHIALQLLDTSSVGRAHEYQQFEQTHRYLQESLKAIVHEYHQGFNSSIGTFHKIQTSIQSSQKRVRNLKECMVQSKASITTTDPELRKLATASQNYNDLIHTLSEIEEIRQVPDQLEARISEKRFVTAVDIVQTALRRIRAPGLEEIGALNDLKNYLLNQETALSDILIEELHDHLYLKSPYCQERWQTIAKSQSALYQDKFENSTTLQPFYLILDSIDFTESVTEDPAKNPEANTFSYIGVLVESLNKLGRLEFAVNAIKQRLPVELSGIVNETNSEVDQRHPNSLRGSVTSSGNQSFGSRENTIRTDVIYDLLGTLYAKLESIAESHRIFHESIKAIVRREGRNSSMILGGFRELWNLYQNEIQSLLRNYVTTDSDVYQISSSKSGSSKQDLKKDKIFQFVDADTKSSQMMTELQELEGIIRSAVPGLISGRNQASDNKKLPQKSVRTLRKGTLRRGMSNSGYEDKSSEIGSYRSLVEPSVFNMSLLLPPTLDFLQKLKIIVPPGSELVTSTLTSFLDNFLVNVFLPQLDETLGKLSDSLFEQADAFQQDPQWATVSRRPVFKGTVEFFNLITAFSRMLDAIPHDQALTQLIITQMIRYYDHCYDWFKSLTSKARDSEVLEPKMSAFLATGPSDIHTTLQTLWNSEKEDLNLIEKEITQLIKHVNNNSLQLDDTILDREIISSLCVLYTSMKWLAIKITALRHITRNNSNSSHTTIKNSHSWEWSLRGMKREQNSQPPVYLPMTQETVVGFDSIVSSYHELAEKILLTLHMEIRCQTIYALTMAMSPIITAPYLLEQAVNNPDPKILRLNADLITYDEVVARLLRDKETVFIRRGLGLFVENFLIANAGQVGAMNAHGCGRMLLNILVLQQNLKAIEPDVSLGRAARFFDLFTEGPDAIVKYAKDLKDNSNSMRETFCYEDLKTLIELCYSEQTSSSDRGNTTISKRDMAEHLLQLSEYMWQS
ncbi:putative exocyst complex component [Podosphaera aphanis]|nr:putative exocyst complex component [Podosphaera aphanis]